jgi:hypothetical protein
MWLACRPWRDDGAVRWWRPLARADLLALLATLVGVGAVLLPWLDVYPLDVGGDALRDGGLLTLMIQEGEIKQIFEYGFFAGFTYVVPFVALPYLLFFGASAYAFKAVAATVGALTAFALYALARRDLSPLQALLAVGFLLSMPVFVYHARLETMVIFNAFWMAVLLGALFSVFDREGAPAAFGIVGLLAGLTTLFHAAAKASGFLALGIAACWAIWRTIRGRQSFGQLVRAGVVSVAAFVVGMGSVVLETGATNLLSLHKISTGGQDRDWAATLDAYQSSLRVFFDEPILARFPLIEPLIPSAIVSALFAIGVLLGFFVLPRRVYFSLLFLVFLLPFTNSAVTDSARAAHRLIPLTPVAALFAAAGVAVLWRGARRLRPDALQKATGFAIASIAAAAAIVQAARFFTAEQGLSRELLTPYLVHAAFQEIDAEPTLRAAPALCVTGNDKLREDIDYAHYREGWRFYRRKQALRITPAPVDARRNEIYVSTCGPSLPAGSWSVRMHCAPREPFVCPGEETGVGELRVYVDARPFDAEYDAKTYGGRPLPLTPPTPTPTPAPPPAGAVKLDLAALIAAGEITIEVNDPTFASQIPFILDGRTDSVIRSNSVNPLTIDVTMRSPIRVRAVRAKLPGSRHDLSLDPAPGQPRIVAQNVPEDVWASLEPPAPQTTTHLHLEIRRLDRDDYVHVSELEIWADETAAKAAR